VLALPGFAISESRSNDEWAPASASSTTGPAGPAHRRARPRSSSRRNGCGPQRVQVVRRACGCQRCVLRPAARRHCSVRPKRCGQVHHVENDVWPGITIQRHDRAAGHEPADRPQRCSAHWPGPTARVGVRKPDGARVRRDFGPPPGRVRRPGRGRGIAARRGTRPQ